MLGKPSEIPFWITITFSRQQESGCMTKSSQLSWGCKTPLFIKEKENLGRNLLFCLVCWPQLNRKPFLDYQAPTVVALASFVIFKNEVSISLYSCIIYPFFKTYLVYQLICYTSRYMKRVPRMK